MPVKVLKSGASVLIDDVDDDLFDHHSWHIFTLRPSMRPTAARTEVRYGREYRILMHRLIATRMRPDLVAEKRQFKVRPRNGDYLDCRRENLEIVVVLASKRGRKKIEHRPIGHLKRRYTGTGPRNPVADPSVLWAGGFEYRAINQTFKGGKFRIRRCLNGKPVD